MVISAVDNEKNASVLSSSFRDPSGFIFEYDGVLYRQINYTYRGNYDFFIKSGLYECLSKGGFLIRHEELNGCQPKSNLAYKIIRPERVSFISYPYEWCFNQLKDAALLTLDIQLSAMNYNMTLKDASSYNIQFDQGRPVMIDTLSFEKYIEGRPWVAYRQFCQHFLAPLALMAKCDIRLNKLLLSHIDGIPLDLTTILLPRSTWLLPGLAIHLHIHAKAQKAYSETAFSKNSVKKQSKPISKTGLIGIIQGLRKTIASLKCKLDGTEWADYYFATNYSDAAFSEKKRTVLKYLEKAHPSTVWDFGSNIGVFSRLASGLGIPTISFDIDPAAVDMNYCQVREKREKMLLPILFDLTNPSPDIGWDNRERDSLYRRGPAGCIMALALIHHLAISNNVPLLKAASFFSKLCTFLIIEFVPKQDSQVKRLLSSRNDIFDTYDQLHFESSFSQYFKIIHSQGMQDSHRRLYLMQKSKQ